MKKSTSTCTFKHTPYDPPKQKWRCPNCGKRDDFVINFSPNDDCLMVHDEDELLCMSCNYEASGKVAMRALAKVDNRVTCPTCHGQGSIKGP
jgi:Zn finger protein HypA/HybF involved in hydrogenase expression